SPAPAAARDQQLSAVSSKLPHQIAALRLAHHGSHWDQRVHRLGVGPMLETARPRGPVVAADQALAPAVREARQPPAPDQVDLGSPSAVPAVRTAARNVFLAPEGSRAMTAPPRAAATPGL